MFADQGIQKVKELLKDIESPRLLDIGCGKCEQAKKFVESNIQVTGVDIAKPDFEHPNFRFFEGFFEIDMPLTRRLYDVTWACHILEHTLNPDEFLTRMLKFTAPGGYIAITVPPIKPNIVGGHINLFNPGLLMYRLILLGVDCSKAIVKTYGYNQTVIVQKTKLMSTREVRQGLFFDNGDIEKLSKYFPKGYDYQGFNGNIKELNW